jgi:hypothetical protein
MQRLAPEKVGTVISRVEARCKDAGIKSALPVSHMVQSNSLPALPMIDERKAEDAPFEGIQYRRTFQWL